MNVNSPSTWDLSCEKEGESETEYEYVKEYRTFL